MKPHQVDVTCSHSRLNAAFAPAAVQRVAANLLRMGHAHTPEELLQKLGELRQAPVPRKAAQVTKRGGSTRALYAEVDSTPLSGVNPSKGQLWQAELALRAALKLCPKRRYAAVQAARKAALQAAYAEGGPEGLAAFKERLKALLAEGKLK